MAKKSFCTTYIEITKFPPELKDSLLEFLRESPCTEPDRLFHDIFKYEDRQSNWSIRTCPELFPDRSIKKQNSSIELDTLLTFLNKHMHDGIKFVTKVKSIFMDDENNVISYTKYLKLCRQQYNET